MIQGRVIVNSRGKGIDAVHKLMGEVTSELVLVGITENKAPRKSDREINNAQLMYIHTHGSPINNIPARPVIEPALEAKGNKEAIYEEMGAAFKAGIEGNKNSMQSHLKKAGMIGQNVSRAWFVDPRNGWPPNAPETIRRKGSDRPLIDTSELRKSITYVIENKKK